MTAEIAVVLWSGDLGGAETFSAALCRKLPSFGTHAHVLFVTDSGALADRLDASGTPYTVVGLERGRDVLRHPRALARLAATLGPDGVLLPQPGYLALALRLGGYRGLIASVAHDATTDPSRGPLLRRLLTRGDLAAGGRAADAEIAVSDFMLERVRSRPHPRRILRIYNGVDLESFAVSPLANGSKVATIGWTGRMVHGKGIDLLLRAFAPLADGARLRLAGDGPLRGRYAALARALGIAKAVDFVGWTHDLSSFWRDCHIGVTPSNEITESFGVAAVEAMACGRPVILADNGGLPELVSSGGGRVVARGNREALEHGLRAAVEDEQWRVRVGHEARAHCETTFDIGHTAKAYAELFLAGEEA